MPVAEAKASGKLCPLPTFLYIWKYLSTPTDATMYSVAALPIVYGPMGSLSLVL